MKMRPVPAASATDLERFFAKTSRTDGCWLWTGTKTSDGYGRFSVGGALLLAHRVAYVWLSGPIPEGLELDHLCRVRHCVRPSHLEPVTSRENALRGVSFSATNIAKTHCPQGHPYTPENTYVYDGPGNRRRCCRVCNRAAVALSRSKRLAS